MSSHGSAILRIELPERLLADALAAAVWLALGLTLTVSVGPREHWLTAAAAGLSGAIGAFVTWSRGVFRRVRTITVTPDGSLRVSHDEGRIGEPVEPVGHRVMGSTVYLRWRFPGSRYHPGAGVWITPRDVRPADLRRLAVCLRCAGRLGM